MRSGFLLTAMFPLAAAAQGCAGNVSTSAEAADAEVNGSTTAIVAVERSAAAPTPAAEALRGEAVARFVRLRGPAGDDALRAVGAALELPPVGECVRGAGPSNTTQEPTPSVQLVDVGTVSMEADGVRTELPVRQIPDVVDWVSGVFYARATEALPAQTEYVLRVSGAPDEELLPFALTANAPPDPTDVRVAGQDGQQLVELPAGGDLDLTWEPGAQDDVLYVDVTSPGGPGLRCAFADASGRAVVGASVLGGVQEGTLGVHRLHRERFVTRGIDAGELRFDFARMVAFSRR
jgi:hypothetical protein